MPVAASCAPFVDARVLASLVTQPLHREVTRLVPIEIPSREELRREPRVGGRTIGKRKQRHLLLTYIDENAIAFTERIHRMPRHTCRAAEPSDVLVSAVSRHNSDVRAFVGLPRDQRRASHRTFDRYCDGTHREDDEVSGHRE